MTKVKIGLLCCLALFCRPNAAKAQGKEFAITAIAFYNLENFFNPEDNPETNDEDFTPNGAHRYTEAIFERKANNMAEVLAQLGTEYGCKGAALIGVCEVEDDRALKTLLQQPQLKKRNYRYVKFDGPDKRGINIALLYQQKYFKLISAKPLPINLKFAGGGITRDVLLVQGVMQGDTVFVLVNHWPSRSGGETATAPKRWAAAEVNKQAVEQIYQQNPQARIIIMGDLNDDPIDKSVHKILAATGDSVLAIQQHLLYNPWWQLYQKGFGTLSHNDHWNLFDQIILSPEWLGKEQSHWQFFKARVFDKDFLKNTFGAYRGYPHRSYQGNKWIDGYSDHFPTQVYLIKELKNKIAEN